MTLPQIPSMNEFLEEEEEPIEWAIDQFIPKGSLSMLVGPPESMKTWFAILMAQAIGCGNPFLGLKTEHQRVLYVDLENPQCTFRARAERMTFSPQTYIWGNWSTTVPPSIENSIYLDLIRDGYTFIIFDSLIRFHRYDQNVANQMARVMSALRKMTSLGATVIFLHHRSVKDLAPEFMGSTEMLAGVDQAFLISKRDHRVEHLEIDGSEVIVNKTKIILRPIKSRHFIWKKEFITLMFEEDGMECHLHNLDLPQLIPERTPIPSQQTDYVIQFLEQFIQAHSCYPTQKQIVEELKKHHISAIKTREILKEGEGTFWHSAKRRLKRGRHINYFLPGYIYPLFHFPAINSSDES